MNILSTEISDQTLGTIADCMMAASLFGAAMLFFWLLSDLISELRMPVKLRNLWNAYWNAVRTPLTDEEQADMQSFSM